MHDIVDDYGIRIKTARKEQKLTQERLAELLEVEPNTLQNWEKQRYYPSPENVDRIGFVLGLDLRRGCNGNVH